VRFLPAWFPFARFKHVLKANRKMLDDIEIIPFEWAKNKIVRLPSPVYRCYNFIP
jgi:hypothetical protein